MDKFTLETYISQGLSTHQVAKITNKSQTNVSHWLKKFNLKTTNKSFSQGFAAKEKIIENEIEYKICPKCPDGRRRKGIDSRCPARPHISDHQAPSGPALGKNIT